MVPDPFCYGHLSISGEETILISFCYNWGMYVHIALYKWKANVSIERIAKALSDIESLADKVPGIIEIITAENISRYNEGYTHVILVRGKDQAAIDAYRSHPDHVVVARQLDTMEERGIGVDFETK
jgi:hypothetical protein